MEEYCVDTKIWVLRMLIATGMSLILGPLRRETWEIYVCVIFIGSLRERKHFDYSNKEQGRKRRMW